MIFEFWLHVSSLCTVTLNFILVSGYMQKMFVSSHMQNELFSTKRGLTCNVYYVQLSWDDDTERILYMD